VERDSYAAAAASPAPSGRCGSSPARAVPELAEVRPGADQIVGCRGAAGPLFPATIAPVLQNGAGPRMHGDVLPRSGLSPFSIFAREFQADPIVMRPSSPPLYDSCGRPTPAHTTGLPGRFALRMSTGRSSRPGVGRISLLCPRPAVTVDIHCVTKVVQARYAMEGGHDRRPPRGRWPRTAHTLRYGVRRRWVHDEPGAGGSARGRGLVVYEYDGAPIEPEQRGPRAAAGATPVFLEVREVGARARLMERNEPGFWETRGYHLRGDPWKENATQETELASIAHPVAFRGVVEIVRKTRVVRRFARRPRLAKTPPGST